LDEGELIGYARCSTVLQDLTAQREILADLGVEDDRIYLDKGLTGTNRARPGLDQPLAAVRAGDTLVVPKLGRLARSVPDARDIGDTLVARGVAVGRRLYRSVARQALSGFLVIAPPARRAPHRPSSDDQQRHTASRQMILCVFLRSGFSRT
jgi:hypothetical protein